MPGALPSGTVAFLFTDIAGSTKLLDQLGAEGYAVALERHRAVIRAALDAHRGIEVDTQGDAFFCAFASPRDAVECACAAREGLEATPVRVRMGIHAGEAIVSSDRYVGLEVHRAARIGACGHGGQIVVSSTTAARLDPDAVQLRDLGEHWLKDLGPPIRLFQLGEGDFPPLRTLYRTNLPVPATVFVGRGREAMELVDLATRSDTKLLTLTGSGGTGKTRLALHVAGELAKQFTDGVFWVPLAPLREARYVASAVAEALGVVEEAGVPLEQTLERETAGRRMLVLMDNCEHVLEGVERVVPGLVRTGVLILATSRERLDLSGERVYPVNPLEREEAIALFAVRAEAAGAVLGPRAETREAVDALCTRLDDLPLALELAAAHAAVLPLPVLLERLSDRLDLLTGTRDAEERQRTLRAAIAWSYDLLEPHEQSVFRRLAVFAGGGSLDAVESVCGAKLQDLLSLVGKSLVRRRAIADQAAFWVLETVREFARIELEASGEADATRDRHLDWFLAQARPEEVLESDGVSDTFGMAESARLHEIERDVDNYRAAFNWALTRARAAPDAAARSYSDALVSLVRALRPFYAVRGRFAEAENVLRAALPHAADPITDARLRSWLAQAMRSSPAEAWRMHVEAERMLAREADRTSRRWWSAWLDVKLAQAHHHYWMNNQNALARTAEQLQTDLQTHGTPAQRIDCLSVLLKETYRRQRYVLTEDSDDLADAFYCASVEIGDRYAEFQRGFHLLWRGKLNDALSHLEAGRDIARDIGDPVMEVRCLTYGAIAHRKLGDLKGAQALLDELGSLRDRHGYDGLLAANHAWMAWRLGELDEVTRRAAEALADWQRTTRSRPTVFQWTARFPLLAAELVRGRTESAFEHASWLVDPSQQPLPIDLDQLVRRALERRGAGRLSRAVELGRSQGYT